MLQFITKINWPAIFIILITMVITVLPIDNNEYYLPNWQVIALGVLYIVIGYDITTKNMIYAIFIGVIFDVLTGEILGVNSLILVTITYIFWEHKTAVSCDSLFREMIFIAALTFFISILHVSLSRLSVFPLLPKYYIFSTITTVLLWFLLRLSFYKNYHEQQRGRYS